MEEKEAKFCIINGRTEPVKELDGQEFSNKNLVYEIIRVIKGVPLFYEDHYVRLRNSLGLVGIELKTSEGELKDLIGKLIKENGLTDCNVKIVVYEESGVQNCVLFVNKSYYPAEEEYERGVKVSLLCLERANPNAKIINKSHRDMAARRMEETGAFEVLLVNKENKITEGSRSNVFFVKGQKVFTAPDRYVLQGVTRKYVIEACRKVGVEIVETLTEAGLLKTMDGLFISGTSIKVLPVSEVDGLKFQSCSNTVITAIRKQYDMLMEEYISKSETRKEI